MAVRFFTFGERPDLARRYYREAAEIWPPHMEWVHHDPVCEAHWPRLGHELPGFQLVGFDEDEQRFLAVANAVPVAWSGLDADLPDGVPTVLRRAFADDANPATSLCALLVGIHPAARSQGLSAAILTRMASLARAQDLRWLIAPVRPTLKARYPLTPAERYATWRRDDGQLFDPWLRTHERLGARVAGIAREGNVFRGTVAEWERWTGVSLPETGSYVVDGALEPLRIDRDGDEGVLVEPNVWMVRDAGRGGVRARPRPCPDAPAL